MTEPLFTARAVAESETINPGDHIAVVAFNDPDYPFIVVDRAEETFEVDPVP